MDSFFPDATKHPLLSVHLKSSKPKADCFVHQVLDFDFLSIPDIELRHIKIKTISFYKSTTSTSRLVGTFLAPLGSHAPSTQQPRQVGFGVGLQTTAGRRRGVLRTGALDLHLFGEKKHDLCPDVLKTSFQNYCYDQSLSLVLSFHHLQWIIHNHRRRSREVCANGKGRKARMERSLNQWLHQILLTSSHFMSPCPFQFQIDFVHHNSQQFTPNPKNGSLDRGK